MELKGYKYIQNTKPKYDDGKVTMDLKPIQGVGISSSIKSQTFGMDGKLKGMNDWLSKQEFKLPEKKFDTTKFMNGVNTATGIASDAIGAYSSISNAFNAPIKSAQQMNDEAGQNNTSIGGVSVQLQNSVDTAAQNREIDAENKSNTMAAAGSGAKLGSSVGSLLGPVGGVVGGALGGIIGGIAGIFGGKSRKRKLEERMRIMRGQQQYNNSVQMDTAMSTAMDNDWSVSHENTQDDILYANKGKDSMRKYNNGKVWSPTGYGYGATNSKVGLGESIVNFRTGKGTLITKGTKGVDDQDSSVRPGDDNTIFGNMTNPYSGMLFSDQAAPLTARLQQLNAMSNKRRKDNRSSLSGFTQQVQQRELERAKQQTLGQLQELANQQEEVHLQSGEGSYNCGKLPRFNDGDDAINQYLDGPTVLGRRPQLSYFNPPAEVFRGRDLSGIYNFAFEDIPTGYINPVNIPVSIGGFDSKGVQYPAYMNRDFNRRLRSYRLGGPDQLSAQPNSSSTTAAASQLELPTVTVDNEKPAKKKGSFWSNLNSLFQKDDSGLGDYHTVPALAGALAGYDQYNRANSQEIKGSNIYAPNTYAQRALQGLAEQRIDPYSYTRPLYDAERRGAYQINNSGGMSGGQRQLGRVALALGSQQNMANALRDAYEKNLGYKQAYYNAMLSEGDRDATRRQSANQYDFDTFTKAHAAKEQMRQMGIRNMLSALENYQGQRFNRDMGRKQIELYNRQLNNDERALLLQIQKGAKG